MVLQPPFCRNDFKHDLHLYTFCCPRKIHLDTQCPPPLLGSDVPVNDLISYRINATVPELAHTGTQWFQMTKICQK